MKIKKILFCILGILTLVSCARGSQTQRIPILNENQSIYIMLPDASNATQTYLVQQELKKNFQKFSKADISEALDSSSIKMGFIKAKRQKADVMVCPMITQWLDREKRDKIGINIRIFDVNTQNVIDEQNLYKRNNNFFKDTEPDKLVPSIIQKYVISLYK